MSHKIRFDQLPLQRQSDFHSLCGIGSKLMNEWNSLSNYIRESDSIAAFKRNVLNFVEDN